MLRKKCSIYSTSYICLAILSLVLITIACAHTELEKANGISYSLEELSAIEQHLEANYSHDVEEGKREHFSSSNMYSFIERERYKIEQENIINSSKKKVMKEEQKIAADQDVELQKQEEEINAIEQGKQEQPAAQNNNKESSQEKERKQQANTSKPSEATEENKKAETASENKENKKNKDVAKEEKKDTASLSLTEQVIQLVNLEREKQGLSPLQADKKLNEAAYFKSEDMRNNAYFAHRHESATYNGLVELMEAFGISYRYVGENIAAGQRTAEAVMQSWMKSDGHRQNILNERVTHIGVGYASGGEWSHYWTQIFIQN